MPQATVIRCKTGPSVMLAHPAHDTNYLAIRVPSAARVATSDSRVLQLHGMGPQGIVYVNHPNESPAASSLDGVMMVPQHLGQ